MGDECVQQNQEDLRNKVLERVNLGGEMEDKSCVFCKIVKKEKSAEIVMEGNSFIAFRDANPRAEGHTLVVPKKHWVTLLDIPNTYAKEMMEFVKKVASELMDSGKGDGFNVLMNNLEVAGQVVAHAHIHIIPRKEGDGVKVLG